MKEFTLKADFGMTASDDGFSLYGIHAGDVIMFQNAEDFPANGSIVAVSIDNGPVTLKRINFHGDSPACYLEGGSGKVISVHKDGQEIWAGRVLTESEDFYLNRVLGCEGEFAFFNDSTQPPAEYAGGTIREYLESMLAVHNSKVAENRQFTVGIVTVVDEEFPTYYTNYEKTITVLNALVESYGGHFRVRKEDGIRYPTSVFTTLGSQTVELEYTYEGVTKTTTVTVTVKGKEVAVPTQTDVPTYDGSTKTASWSGYDPLKMEISGVTSAADAGSYTAIFTLNYGYMFPDGTAEARVKWTINRATISTLPTQTGTLVADGTAKMPSWNGYDTTKMTISGDTSGTAAGDYTAVFMPTSNYKWSDGTTTGKEVTWTITSVLVSIPSQSGTLTYDGSAKTPSWSNFDSTNSQVSVTPQTNAGTYTATFTLKTGMWADGTTAAKSISWTIGRATLSTVPAQSGTLTYNGNARTPSWDTNYDAAKMTVAVTAQTNAGTYSATFTPTSNYKWSDGSVGGKTASWKIGKATNTVTTSPTAITLNSSAKSVTLTVTRKGDGVISASSNNTGVATIGSINQTTGQIVVNSVDDTTGTAIITINVAEGTNYLALSGKTVNVTAQFVTIYGVEWDWTSSGSTKGTRTDAAARFSDPSPAVSNGTGSSPFDNLLPWSGMVKETRTGGVMVKEPKYYFKWTKTGKKLKLQIADGPVEGFSVDPVNRDRGDGLGELDYKHEVMVKDIAEELDATPKGLYHMELNALKKLRQDKTVQEAAEIYGYKISSVEEYNRCVGRERMKNESPVETLVLKHLELKNRLSALKEKMVG